VLIAHLAGTTRRIRLGSGGVMLPNHPALVIAEQFAMLEALHPGRIDLGIGRAPGADPMTAAALRRTTAGLGVEEFPAELIDVLALLGQRVEGTTPSAGARRLAATPRAESTPQVWLLGSSTVGAQLAGQLGMPFAYAHHFSTGQTEQAVAAYRAAFRPSDSLHAPHLMITTSVLIASSAEDARFLAGPSRVMALSLRTGRLGPVVSPEEAERVLAEVGRNGPAQVAELLAGLPGTQVVGTASDAVAALEVLVARTGADELMVTGTTFDVSTRIQTLEELASAWHSVTT
jgi:luciferase family oxidoreductase group 1